jgi:hypothetical protein
MSQGPHTNNGRLLPMEGWRMSWPVTNDIFSHTTLSTQLGDMIVGKLPRVEVLWTPIHVNGIKSMKGLEGAGCTELDPIAQPYMA